MRFALAFVSVLFAFAGVAVPRPSPAESVATYEAFTAGAQAQHGLFTIWRKDGKVYLELTAAQLDREYIQTIVPASGLGGNFVVYGNTDHLPAELVRFERAGNSVAIIWPSPYFVARTGTPAARALDANFARSIVGLAPIAAQDVKTGTLIVDAEPFLNDQLNLKDVLKAGTDRRAAPYTLDREHSYFGQTKAFPKNIVIEARQAWNSDEQTDDDRAPDPRHLQMRVTYNIAEPPQSADYRPRYADDRVGLYDDIYLQFDNDEVLSRTVRYLIRWNIQPSDPSQPISRAKHPMVFTMSDTVPEKYRPAIKRAVLAWNAAFEKIGISDAVQVVDQPDDPNFDPDDIRYNMLRWVPESTPSFGADSQTLFDPRTGEEFRTGILISANVPSGALRRWTTVVDPVRYGRSTDPMPQSFLDDNWMATIMHETGHDLGLQHNFVGSRAFTAKQLQDPSFTAASGVATTVMEYAPLNIWPKPYGQGNYFQNVLGSYDYYAIHYGYATIPNAATPEDELPALESWASAWSDPRYRYASDEDVSWADGHAVDPRVEHAILTGDPLGWCDVQVPLYRDLIAHLDERSPVQGEAYEDETKSFTYLFGQIEICSTMPERYIGGQYLSRAHRGDPHADPPIVPVPREMQQRAFASLSRDVFASNAYAFPAAFLQHLGYSEWAGYGYVELPGYGNLPHWAYAPKARHDVSVSQLAAARQDQVLDYLFAPATLGRIADGPSESTAPEPMRLADLFSWTGRAVAGELEAKSAGRALRIDSLRQALQHRYMLRLMKLAKSPPAGTPPEAQELAHAEYRALSAAAARLVGQAGDPATKVHLQWLRDIAVNGSLSPTGAM